MGVLDFLFEGSAPTPGTSSSTTQVQLPEWYTQYTTDMLGKAQAASNLPYAQYGGPRIAGFTPTEETGFELQRQAGFSYQPFLSQSADFLSQAGQSAAGLGGGGVDLPSAAAAGQPYFSQAAGMSGASAAAPYLSQAAGVSGMQAAQPYFSQAMDPIQRAGAGSALTATEPYMSAAAQMFPEQVARYMNPYIQGVVQQIAEQGVEQLQEKYLPAVGQEFIQAGQFGVGPGSSRMGEFGARALRDVQKSVLGEQAKALQAGYGQAAEIFGRDAGRQAELAALTGRLSSEDLNRLMQSGVEVGRLGAQAGQLTAEDAARLAQIGQATGQLTSADARTLADIGQAAGQLTGTDAQIAAAMARHSDEMKLAGQQQLANIAGRYADLAGMAQQYGLTGAKQFTETGGKERAMRQANLDLAYQDFLRQEGYPKEQVKFLTDVLRGVELPSTTVSTRTDMPALPGGPSAFEKGISGATGVGTILDLLKKYGFSDSGGDDTTDYDYDFFADYFNDLGSED
jgi:hypothetical protein